MYAQTQIENAGFQKIILVAHSIGGVLAIALSKLMPSQIKHIVYIGASIPKEGKSALSTFPLSEKVGIYFMKWGIPIPEKAMDQKLRETLCNDLDEATTLQFLKGSKNFEPPSLFLERVSRKGMPDIPCTYIKLLKDKGSYPPSKQDELAANIGTGVLTLDSGHTAMLSRPQELAKLLNKIAEETTVN